MPLTHKGYRIVSPSCASKAVFILMRISIYIDGANFLGGLKSINKKYKDWNFDFKRFVESVTKNKQLVDVYYYNALLKQIQNPDMFKLQQELFNRLKSYGFKVNIAKRKPRIREDGTQGSQIKGDDIWLAVDMLKDAYEDKYDTAILISSDGDFVPLVKYIKNKNKQVESYYFEASKPYDLLKECNLHFVIDKKTVNRFFYREQSSGVRAVKQI